MIKMCISLVIEGQESDIHEIKGKIISTASECLVAVATSIEEEPVKEIEVPSFVMVTSKKKV